MENQLLINLTNELDNASRLYYAGKESSMSDTEFDLKLKELQKLEKELGVVLPNSPTQRVGSDIQKEFKKITHPSPMLTIENTYNNEELNEWIEKMEKEHGGPIGYNCSVKYDGISCELHYKGGYLQTGSTRGDKNVGDDITANVKTIKDIPLKLNLCSYTEKDLYVRGEILMPKSSLARVNAQLALEGKKTFANCRNACAGSVKQLDPSVTASRGLIFRPWDVFSDEIEIHSQSDKTNILTVLGFSYEDGTAPWFCNNKDYNKVTDAVDIFYEKLKSMDLDFDWDGIVIKVDSIELQEEIGTKDNRAIEWGIARKWNEDKEVITRLEGVEFQVGRTGNITPVGKLTPVPCDGVIISNVILNNEKYIKDLGIMINKPIKIVRSGSVIPKAIGSATEEEFCKFTYGDNPWPMLGHIYTDIQFPKTCPVCGHKLVKEGEIWKCQNPICLSKLEGNVLQWCSKVCMDIEGVGPSVVKDLREMMSVITPMHLYYMIEDYTPNDVVNIMGSGYGLKSIKTMFANIKKTMDKPFELILFGMGIPGIGKENAKNVAKAFGSLDNIIKASIEELSSVEGIGTTLAENIRSWMDEYGQRWLEDLEYFKMNTKYEDNYTPSNNEQLLDGLNVVFTGKSKYWEGDQVEEVLTSYGAKCGHGVSKKLDCLITGDKPGPAKVNKAKELGIQILTEDEFLMKYNIPTDAKSDVEITPKFEKESNKDIEALF